MINSVQTVGDLSATTVGGMDRELGRQELAGGLVPKFGALMTTIPYPVLGGATVTVFGMITMTGIQLLTRDELSSRNITIASLAIALSMGIYASPGAIAGFPEMLKLVLGGPPIVVAALVSITLNLALPRKSLDEERREREAHVSS